MERLRDFTENALKRRETMRESHLQAECAANEEKLKHVRLVRNESVEDSDLQTGFIPATFMPMPGNVATKGRDMKVAKGILLGTIFNGTGIVRPWGGRFKSPVKKSTEVCTTCRLSIIEAQHSQFI